MRLYNKYGTFDLPDGFALNLERTNPFFTDEGDTSIPVTLPSSPHNLQLLEHIERIDAKSSDMTRADAWLMVGAVTVKGVLIIDTLSKDDGIDAAFSFRNGGLYADFKDKSLKEIFADKVETYEGGVEEACKTLQEIYNGELVHPDFTCFPVMGEAEESVAAGHCIINNVVGNELISYERECNEGGLLLHVPMGYGITPFLYLHRLVALLFELMGYTVTVNTFASRGDNLLFVVLNNCVDTVVNGSINYADLVPDMTVSDFLNWLRDRFMVQAVVDGGTMSVKVVSFNDIVGSDVGNGTDMDITGLQIGGVTMRHEMPSRVVITPSVGSGCEPVTDTLKALKERYGSWAQLSEIEFWSIHDNNNPAYADCLVLRRSTGVFYELRRDVATGQTVMVDVGTNYFTYDRANADGSESFAPVDIIPRMYCDNANHIMPVVGDHIHNHTTFNGMKANGKQDLMFVIEHIDGQHHSGFKRCGTTQNYIPLTDPGTSGLYYGFGTTPELLYASYWNQYNNMLLNGKKTAVVRLGYDVPTFLTLDMSVPKTFLNQKLLPVKMTTEIGQRNRNGDSEFVVVKPVYETTDSAILPGAVNRFRWVMDNKAVSAFMANCLQIPKYFTQALVETNQADPDWWWFGVGIVNGSSRATINGTNAQIFLGPPTAAGLSVTVPVEVTVTAKVHCTHLYADKVETLDIDVSYSASLYVYFTSEAY